MVGDKLTQTKISLKAIFGQLRERDLFNLVLFSSQVQAWKAKPVPVTKETVQEVDIFVDALHASGGKVSLHHLQYESISFVLLLAIIMTITMAMSISDVDDENID